MALPSPSDLDSMDYVCCAQPFVSIPAKTGLNLKSMDYVFQAQPFITNDYPSYPIILTAVQDGTHIDLTWTRV